MGGPVHTRNRIHMGGEKANIKRKLETDEWESMGTERSLNEYKDRHDKINKQTNKKKNNTKY